MNASSEGRTYAANPADLGTGTLVDLFFDAADADYGEAMRYRAGPEDWRSISWIELVRRTRRLALALEALGLERGDRLAILSENRPEWAIADLASLCAGIVDVPVYPTLIPEQIGYILADAEVRLIFVSTRDQLEKVREVRPELDALEHVVVFDDVVTDDARRFAELLELGEREEDAGAADGFRDRARSAQPEDVATVLYTSGTTGEPKGVMLTHNNIWSNIEATSRILPMGEDDVALSFLPLSHILERMVDFRLLTDGAVLAYVADFDLVATALREVRPTLAAATPRVYEKTFAAVMTASGLKKRIVLWARDVAYAWADAELAGQRPGLLLRAQHALADRLVYSTLRERLGGEIRYFISGGAPLAAHLTRFFYGAGIMILEGYGLTETSPVTNVNTPESLRPGTVGKPIPGTEVMIADDGEILIRGPQVMKGYYQRPEATGEAIDGDGWFHTGDIGEIDGDGFLRITDRKKDLIVTAGGKNIAPQPIENAIKASRFVEEAVIVGDRRPYTVLLVVPDFDALGGWAREQGIGGDAPSALIGDARVQAKMDEEVFGPLEEFARYEQPKKVALLVDEFTVEGGELTPTLKVKRRVVEDTRSDVIEMLYGEDGRVFDGTRTGGAAAGDPDG